MGIAQKLIAITTGLFFAVNLSAQHFDELEIRKWKARSRKIKIIRDEWGVPHIYGRSDADAVFGMIYTQCEDNYWGIEEAFIQQLGRRAELYGAKALPDDLFTALFADTLKAKKDFSQLSSYYQSLLQAQADALNFYICQHPQKRRLIARYEPWFPLVVQTGRIKTSGISKTEIYNYLSRRTRSDASPAAAAKEETEIESGSNAWALAPSRTASADAYLLINPHGAISGSGQRTEVHMVSKKGLNVYGAPFFGSMVVWQGFNKHLGWGRTVHYADVNDIYALAFDDPQRPLAYRYDSGYKMAVEKLITIRYREGNTMSVKKFNVLYTDFGPVVARHEGKLIALKDSSDESAFFRQNWSIASSRNLKQFRKWLTLHAEKSCTVTYADKKGNIAYWHANSVPRKDSSIRWWEPIAEIGRRTEWQGLHALDEIPHVINPATGFIQNANSAPWNLAGSASPDSTAYPAYMVGDPVTLRSILGDRIFNNSRRFSFQEFQHSALKNPYLLRYELWIPPFLKKYEQADLPTALRAALTEPIDLLRKWDYKVDTLSIATTLAVLLDEKLYRYEEATLPGFQKGHERNQFYLQSADQFSDSLLFNSFSEVIRELENDFGSWRQPWGRLSRMQRVDHASGGQFSDEQESRPVGAVQNQMGALFDFVSRKTANTKLRYGQKGNSFVAAVAFSRRIRAKTVLVFGQQHDPRSPHYADQSDLYRRGELKDAYFYKKDVLKHAAQQYSPGDAW